jgi:hypothetical protein
MPILENLKSLFGIIAEFPPFKKAKSTVAQLALIPVAFSVYHLSQSLPGTTRDWVLVLVSCGMAAILIMANDAINAHFRNQKESKPESDLDQPLS